MEPEAAESPYTGVVMAELRKMPVKVTEERSVLSPSNALKRATDLARHDIVEPLRVHVLYLTPVLDTISSINEDALNTFLVGSTYEHPIFKIENRFKIEGRHLVLGTATYSSSVLTVSREIRFDISDIKDPKVQEHYAALKDADKNKLLNDSREVKLNDRTVMVYFPNEDVLDAWKGGKIPGVSESTPTGKYCSKLDLRGIYRQFPDLELKRSPISRFFSGLGRK